MRNEERQRCRGQESDSELPNKPSYLDLALLLDPTQICSSNNQRQPSTAMSENDHDITPAAAAALRKVTGRFRILIIGRANAGKTTILQKVCNTTEDPEIFDGEGKKVDSTIVDPSAQRGLHNIDHELVFRSNPGFIFHDSRGFESGGVEELEAVKNFIARRAKETRLREQLHVIWSGDIIQIF
ncbi:hypothetical protein D9615_008527 [Tricholomella constricta]|uniref:G domain-containing protein n=1 Tax=Tricholomella constricta TaxID=117010 RepID=A0A8H5H3Y8_9AGAR|nr:hypothetical protein D9615_008527 [Tricholomella constricta]